MRRGWIIPVLLTVCLLMTGAAAQSIFSDVPSGSWCEEDVAQMAKAGLVKGYGDGTFRPNQKITAAQFVTIVARCAGLSPVQGQSGHWAAGSLQAALQAGWYDWDELPPTGEGFDFCRTPEATMSPNPRRSRILPSWMGAIMKLCWRLTPPASPRGTPPAISGPKAARPAPRPAP